MIKHQIFVNNHFYVQTQRKVKKIFDLFKLINKATKAMPLT